MTTGLAPPMGTPLTVICFVDERAIITTLKSLQAAAARANGHKPFLHFRAELFKF
jgi:hypothetical protein